MRDQYVQHYVDGALLRLSLDALWNHLSWPPSVDNALTMTEWGPFYLTGTSAPFVPIFIRTVDRALHHSGNVWRQLEANLSNARFHLNDLGPDAILFTNDKASKYEIEAFLGAVVGVSEENLIGHKSRNRLGQSWGLDNELQALIRQEATTFKDLAVKKKWHKIRNSAYHLNPTMHDWGSPATIRRENGKYQVELTGVHYEEGASPDLVQVFSETYEAFILFTTRVRDLLRDFSFTHIAVPTNNHYYWATDKLGNMYACLGPTGFVFRHFSETAADFTGPPRPPTT